MVQIGDGVPLFIEELTRMLSDLPSKKRGIALPDIPGTLSEVLTSRIDRLSLARAVLQRASVAGRTVSLDLLELLSPDPPEIFERHLEKCVRSGLIERIPGPFGEVINFRHALIQEAAYRSLHRPDRILLHRRAAEILECRFPERAIAAPEIVAHHFEGAESGNKALEWYVKASNAALSRGALPEAEHHARASVALFSAGSCTMDKPLEGEIQALTLLGHILINRYGFGHPEVAKTFRRVMDLANTGPDFSETSFFGVYGFFVSLWGGTDIRESRKVADALVAMAKGGKEPVARMMSLYADGAIALWEGRFGHCLFALDNCLDMVGNHARSTMTGSTVWEVSSVQVLNIRSWSLWFLGKYRSAETALEQLLAQSLTQESLFKKASILIFALTLTRFFRRPEEALSLCDRLRETNETMKTEGWTIDEHGYRGWAMAHLGHPEGIGLVQKCVAMIRKSRPIAEGFYMTILADSHLALGEVRKCREVADEALKLSLSSGAFFFDAEIHRMKGEAAVLEGNDRTARIDLGKAITIAREQGSRAWELRAAVSLGKLLKRSGNIEEARELFVPLEDFLFGPESDPGLSDIREGQSLLGSLEDEERG